MVEYYGFKENILWFILHSVQSVLISIFLILIGMTQFLYILSIYRSICGQFLLLNSKVFDIFANVC